MVLIEQNGQLTDFIMSEDYASVSKLKLVVQYLNIDASSAHLTASAKISFFSRVSMASRFSARSDNERVRRGSDASRRTKGRPEM